VVLAIYWYNFTWAVPRLPQGSVVSVVNMAPAEMVKVGETGMVPETLAMASTSIETMD
jgi:hypothetical protein